MARAGGVKKGMDFNVAMATLKPRRDELLLWVYKRMVDQCKQRRVTPIATIIPIPTETNPETKLDAQRQVALEREAGFMVIDMLAVYDSLPGYDSLWVATWDRHPNAKGHRMLADKLYDGLLRELQLGKAGHRLVVDR